MRGFAVKLVTLGLAGTVSALVAAGSTPAAGTSAASPHAPALVAASALGPSRGGPALGPYGFKPLHAREFALAKAAANKRAAVGSGSNRRRSGGGAPIVSSYANVTPSFNGTFQTGVTPPDTTGAIGPDRYIETVNTQYAIYSRVGSLVNSGSLSSLTGVSGGLFGHSLSDPQMMWDAKTQRFYYSAVYYDFLLADNGLAVGWSKTATPSSASDFCKYALQFGEELPDYPKLGDSSDFLLYGYNQFFLGSSYDGSSFAILNKPPAGSACAPTSAFAVYSSGVLKNADGSPAATPVPANLVDDSNGSGYVVANADLSVTPSAAFASLYWVATSGTDANGLPVPSVSGPANVPVSSYSMPASAPQNGSSYLLDTLDGRFEAAVAAVDPSRGNAVALWTAHAVFGGAGSEERWYEIDPSAASLLQSGAVTDGSLFVWNGAVSPDRANNGVAGAFGDSMAMSVSTSSTAAYPAIQLVWKKSAGAQSALTNLVQASGASVDLSCSDTSPCRWGDYSGASPDPAATGSVGKVWLGNQYNLAGGTTSSTSWRTWIFAVTPTG
jgi:hypothetical protein